MSFFSNFVFNDLQFTSIMKKRILPAIVLAVSTAACSLNKSDGAAEQAYSAHNPTTATDILGRWYIDNIALNDSTYLQLSQQETTARQYIAFNDSSFFIKTNCNSISGSFIIDGNSISLGEGAMTEMACDDMTAEDALRILLPDVASFHVDGDSILRLVCRDHAKYIELRKVEE